MVPLNRYEWGSGLNTTWKKRARLTHNLMHKKTVNLLLAVFLTILAFGCASNRAPQSPSGEETLVLVGATIYSSPSDAPVANGVVIVRGGKIVARLTHNLMHKKTVNLLLAVFA